MRPAINREHGAMNGCDANHADHRAHRKLEIFAPVDDAVGDRHDSGLNSEFLAPHPVWEHADPRPQGGETELVELHAEDLDLERVALRGAYDFDRTGRAVNIGKGHVSPGKLLADMSDHAVIDIDR